MPYNPNDPNFQTRQSRVASFKDFTDNIGKEKDELKKMNRSSFANPGELNQIPGGRKHKYNKVTHKIDDISKAEVIDKIEDIGGEESKHKYKIVESSNDVYYAIGDSFSKSSEELKLLNYRLGHGGAELVEISNEVNLILQQFDDIKLKYNEIDPTGGR